MARSVTPPGGGAGDPPVELAVLTAGFDARSGEVEQLGAVLARYVVLARGERGCRNVDLVASVTRPGRFLVVSKWDTPDLAQAHLDSALMASTAADLVPLLDRPPDLDLWDALSAHDLR